MLRALFASTKGSLNGAKTSTKGPSIGMQNRGRDMASSEKTYTSKLKRVDIQGRGMRLA